MRTNWKQLCKELVEIFDSYDGQSNLDGIVWDMKTDGNDCLDRARLALGKPPLRPSGDCVPEATRLTH